MTSTTADTPKSSSLERDAHRLNTRNRVDGHQVRPSDIAVGVIIGRSSEFFDFFVYAIASVLVFPSLLFPYVDRLTGTLYAFAIFALAFIARPIGAFVFLWIDERHGRGVKLTIAIFLLGLSTAAMAFVPSFEQAGQTAAWLLALFRLGQGFAQGGTWDGLPALLNLNAPEKHRGWYAMVPQLGAPVGLIVAAGVFAYLLITLEEADFLSWGWRYPFFVAFVINVVALFARLRLISTPEFRKLYESRELQPSPIRDLFGDEWRTIVLGAFAPLASFALFHLVTVFPLSWVTLTGQDSPIRFLMIEIVGGLVGLGAVILSGLIADRIGRRRLLGWSAIGIAIFACAGPLILDIGPGGEWAYMIVGFILLGLSFGQSSGVVNGSFSAKHRYTGAGTTATASWFIGAAFAPLAALFLASRFGPLAVGGYLLSGAACTLLALYLNREWGRKSA